MLPNVSQLKLSDLKREFREIEWQYGGFNRLMLVRRRIPRGQGYVRYLAVRISPEPGNTVPHYIHIAQY